MRRVEAISKAINSPGDTPCQIAQVEFWDARRAYERFKTLVYVVACVVVLFLVAAVVLVSLGSETRAGGIVSFLATAFSGAAMKFVLDQKKEAKEDQDAATKLVTECCGEDKAQLRSLAEGRSPAFLTAA